MSWKQFLKPDWRKITLVLLLFIIFLSINFILLYFNYLETSVLEKNYVNYAIFWSMKFGDCSYYASTGNLTGYKEFNETLKEELIQLNSSQYNMLLSGLEPLNNYKNYNLMLLPISFGVNLISYLLPDFNFEYEMSKIVAVFVYWYLLSCFIFWIYDKFKFRKMKKERGKKK